MEDSNNNAAKQTKILVSSLNNFQGDKGKELLDFIIQSNIIFPRWRWWDDDSMQNVVSLILTFLCILKCFTNIETIPEIESSKGSP